MEDVHDEIHEIDERPPPLRQALEVMRTVPAFLHFLRDVLGDGADVRVRRSTRDHEAVGDVAHAVEVQDDDVVRLQVEAQPRGHLRGGQAGSRCGRWGHGWTRVTDPAFGKSIHGAHAKIRPAARRGGPVKHNARCGEAIRWHAPVTEGQEWARGRGDWIRSIVLATPLADTRSGMFPDAYCLITQTLISGFTSAWSRIGTR